MSHTEEVLNRYLTVEKNILNQVENERKLCNKDLSSDEVKFISIMSNSKIELLENLIEEIIG